MHTFIQYIHVHIYILTYVAQTFAHPCKESGSTFARPPFGGLIDGNLVNFYCKIFNQNYFAVFYVK